MSKALSGSDPQLTCPRCGPSSVRQFSWEALLEHFAAHSGMRLFSCQRCSHGFISGNLYMQHIMRQCAPLSSVPDHGTAVDSDVLTDFYKFQKEAVALWMKEFEKKDDAVTSSQTAENATNIEPGPRENVAGDDSDDESLQNVYQSRRGRRQNRLSSEEHEESPPRKMKLRSDGPADCITESDGMVIENDEPENPDLNLSSPEEINEDDVAVWEEEGDLCSIYDRDDESHSDEDVDDETAVLSSDTEPQPNLSPSRPTDSVPRGENPSQQCPFCSGDHPETDCLIVTDFEDRVSLYKSHMICYRCGEESVRPSFSFLSYKRVMNTVITVLLTCSIFSTIGNSLNKLSHSNSTLSSVVRKKLDPLIIVVTPTYDRPTRMADLIRMSNTLKNLNDIHWIVVEDAWATETHIRKFLNSTHILFTYLATETAKGYPKKGWYQRNFAMDYIRQNLDKILLSHTKAILYFGDDDNTYDLRLFNDYIRQVKILGMWPVGEVGGVAMEAPVVQGGKVLYFDVKFNPNRIFATDMAGFAVNLNEILRTNVKFNQTCHGEQHSPETCLLEDLGFGREDIEPFGGPTVDDLLVWHTKGEKMMYNTAKWARIVNTSHLLDLRLVRE